MKPDLSSYDNLECPRCDKVCKPTSIVANKNLVSYKHDCINGDYTFKIDENGDLID